DERQDEQRDQAVVQEHVAPEAHRQIAAAEQHVERDVAVEEVAGEERERADDRPCERTAEEHAEIPLRDGERLRHGRRSPVSSTSDRNASSSEGSIGTSA